MSGVWDVWSMQRSDGSGLVVGEGTEREARASARVRSEAAARHGMSGTVAFIALPRGRQPAWEDLPPLPPEPEGPRTLTGVQNDLAALAMAHHGSRAAPDFAVGRARELAAEAYKLGQLNARENGRESLAKAWSAILGLLIEDTEFWRCLPYDDPELYARCRQAFLNGKGARQ
jgi:hypothetical protein